VTPGKEIAFPIRSAAWTKEKNSYMDIPSHHRAFFPDDCFIDRGSGKQNAHRAVTSGVLVHYDGEPEAVPCLLEVRLDSGSFRPAGRGYIKRFFKFTGAKPGDLIVIKCIAPRSYSVSLRPGV
jgi:hypothetical protein